MPEIHPLMPKNRSALPVLRDMCVFQFKLLLDSFRDLLLSPVSIVATFWGVITQPDDPGRYLRRVKHFGKRSDAWINLFGNYRPGLLSRRKSSDAYVHKLESLLLREYEKGGMVRNVKDGTDSLIERIQKEHRAARKRSQ